jgi:hypothetical protein
MSSASRKRPSAADELPSPSRRRVRLDPDAAPTTPRILRSSSGNTAAARRRSPRTPTAALSPSDIALHSAPAEIIAPLPPRTPVPRRVSVNSAPAVIATPFTRNSGNVHTISNSETPLRDPPSNMVRSEMDLLLFDELYGNVEFGCAGLWDRFNDDTFDHLCTQSSALGLHNGLRWTSWPQHASESNVLSFLDGLFERLRVFIPDHLDAYSFIPSGSVPLRNGDCTRQTDLVFATTFGHLRQPLSAPPDVVPSWAHVRVIGELKSNPEKSDHDSTVVQIANYAREVFGNQSWRRWVLCFTLCGSEMRIWQFDRGGGVGSTTIDIHVHWRLFLKAFFSFSTMDAAAIGFDPTIRCIVDGVEGTFDSTLAAYVSEPLRPYIWIPTAIAQNSTSVDGACTAAGADVPPSIAAYTPSTWSRLELQPSSMTKRWAIVTRSAMCCRAKLWGAEDWTYVVKDQWRAPERAPEGDLISRCSCSDATGLPRLIWHSDVQVHNSSGTVLAEDIASLRPASSRTPGNRRATPILRKVSDSSHHLLRAGCALQNRVHTRLVISPAGLSLNCFPTYTALLSALRDAIAGHRHMYTTHHILHRDVSVNNIILSRDLASVGGILIDFDLAISTTRTISSGATQRTGTFDFMAHEVLKNPLTPHTALHDLESFFYVLLWLCIYYDRTGNRREPPPMDTVFPKPTRGQNPYRDASLAKRVYRSRSEFENDVVPTLSKDARRLRPVLLAWHRILFPPAIIPAASTEELADWDPDALSFPSDDEEDDDEQQKQPSSEDIERRIREVYDSVLALLGTAIDKLGGR